MLRLAEAALRRLLCIDDRVRGCLDLVCPAHHYTPKEIAQTAEWARALARASRKSPAALSSGLILAFTSDVRSELVRGRRAGRSTRIVQIPLTPLQARRATPAINLYSSVWVQLDQSQEQEPASPPPRSRRPMILVAERILRDPPTSPPPSTGGAA
jgi:hypothetical protein